MRMMRVAIVIACSAPVGVAADEKNYTIETNVPAEVKVGEAAVARLALVPKAPHHANREYPTRLRISAPAEVALPKPEQKIADATSWTEARVEFSVPFTASKAGAFVIDVDFKSAVCTKETCVPLREKIAWKVTAR